MRYNKNEVTLYFRKCNPDEYNQGYIDNVCQDEYKQNPDELLPLIMIDGYLYLKEYI